MEYISDLWKVSSRKKSFKKEQLQVDRKQHSVEVTGYVDPAKVLNRVKRTGKKAEFCPYLPYDVVFYPYAPPGYVRNVLADPDPAATEAAVASPAEERISTAFSDDNPNTCCVM